MDFVKLLTTDLSVGEVTKLVSSPGCGATSIFVGTTRDNFEGKTVKRLVYEAYDGMAEKAMKKLCTEIRSKWKVHGIAMYHRLGEVSVEEASVIIAISSEHRAESLEAVQYAIDRLKAEVPIWKKEEYDGDVGAKWKENKESSWIKTEPKESAECDDDLVSIVVDDVSPELIQVKASEAELMRRMESFIDYKRNQVNLSNVRDFCSNSSSESGCARVDAVVVRQQDSKGHLRVRRVLNKTGPQTEGIEQWPPLPAGPSAVPTVKHMKRKTSEQEPSLRSAGLCPPAVEERLRNAEVHLGLMDNRPVPKDVYARLKELEDRILFLEGVSPEYSQVLVNVPKLEPVEMKPIFKKKVYSVDDLDKKMRDLEKSIEIHSPKKEAL